MADNTPLEMLQLGNQQTQFAVSAINSAINQAAQLRQQKEQFDESLSLKKLQIDESSRQTEANIQDSNTKNWLSYQRFQLDSQLQPLRIQATNMELQANALKQRRELEQWQNNHFNAFTQDQDTVVGSVFSQNQNPDFARAYMTTKAKYRQQVANGGDFDQDGFNKDVQGLVDSYKDHPADPTYRPETAYLMRQFGDTAGAARYDQKNPVFQGNKQAMTLSAILAGGEESAKILGQPSNQILFTDPGEVSNIVGAAYQMDNLNGEIDTAQKEVQSSQLLQGKAQLTPEMRANASTQMQTSLDKLKTLKGRRDGILQRFLTNPPDAFGVTDTISTAQKALDGAKGQMSTVNGNFPKAPDITEGNYDLLSKQSTEPAKIAAMLPDAFPSSGQQFSYLRGINVKDIAGHRDFIRQTVYQNLNRVSDDQVDQLFNDNKLDAVLSTLKGNAISSSGAGRTNDARDRSGPTVNDTASVVSIGSGVPWYPTPTANIPSWEGDGNDSYAAAQGTKAAFPQLQTRDDILKYIRSIPDKEQRSLVARRLYADLATGAMVQAYSK